MAKQDEKQSAELAAVTTLTAFKNLTELIAFGNEIAKSGISPLKEGKDVMAAVLFGQELGMPPMVSVNNIYPINGRGTLSVHMINALLQKNGVVVEKIRDYEPVVYFTLKEDGSEKAAFFDKSGKLIERDKDGKLPQGIECTPMILREGFADEQPKSHEVKGTKIIGFKTVLRFTRKLKQLDGTYKDTMAESSFSTMEAFQAELMGNPKKENWVKYPRQMTLNRALAFGGRLIAADIMLGMSETSEMADANNIPYKMEDVGHVVIESNVPGSNQSIKSSENPVDSKVEEGSTIESNG